jgi:hypothetical protein
MKHKRCSLVRHKFHMILTEIENQLLVTGIILADYANPIGLSWGIFNNIMFNVYKGIGCRIRSSICCLYST